MKKVLFVLGFLCSQFLNAQWENSYVFFGAGLSYYQGDLNQTSFPSSDILNTSYKGGVGYNFSTRFGATVHYTKSKLNGSDLFSGNEERLDRGLSFNSPLTEFGLNLKVRNLTGKEGRRISYLYSGINYFQFNPVVTRSQSSDVNYAVESGFPKSGVNIPFGLGFGWWFTGNIGFVCDLSLHTTFTDYIDGVSKNGNANFKDGFVDSHIMILFRFSEWEGTGKKSQRRSRGWSPGKVKTLKCPNY